MPMSDKSQAAILETWICRNSRFKAQAALRNCLEDSERRQINGYITSLSSVFVSHNDA